MLRMLSGALYSCVPPAWLGAGRSLAAARMRVIGTVLGVLAPSR